MDELIALDGSQIEIRHCYYVIRIQAANAGVFLQGGDPICAG